MYTYDTRSIDVLVRIFMARAYDRYYSYISVLYYIRVIISLNFKLAGNLQVHVLYAILANNFLQIIRK